MSQLNVQNRFLIRFHQKKKREFHSQAKSKKSTFFNGLFLIFVFFIEFSILFFIFTVSLILIVVFLVSLCLDIFFRISQFSAQHWKWKNVSQLNIQNRFNKVSLKKSANFIAKRNLKKTRFSTDFFWFLYFLLNSEFYFYREFDFRQEKVGNSEEYGLIQNKITGDLEALIPVLTELSSSKLITEAKKWGFRIKKFLFN